MKRVPTLSEDLVLECVMRGHQLDVTEPEVSDHDGRMHARWSCLNDNCSAVVGIRLGRSEQPSPTYYGGMLMRVCQAGPVTRRRPNRETT